MSEYGMGNAVRCIKRFASQGYFDSESEVNAAIDQSIKRLEECREDALEAFYVFDNCTHEDWRSSTFSVQRRVLGFVTVYERICKSCRYCQSVTVGDNANDKPLWGDGAQETYHNNDL